MYACRVLLLIFLRGGVSSVQLQRAESNPYSNKRQSTAAATPPHRGEELAVGGGGDAASGGGADTRAALAHQRHARHSVVAKGHEHDRQPLPERLPVQ